MGNRNEMGLKGCVAACGFLFLGAFPGLIQAAPVTLQEGTAGFSQGSFSPDEMINSVFGGPVDGWAVGGNTGVDNVAVFETAADVSFAGGALLTITMSHGASGGFQLGHFRFSVTTDDRSQFADGLDNAGDVTANWIPLVPSSAVSANGSTMTIDGSSGTVLVSGANPDTDTFTVKAVTPVQGITGIRLEALAHPSLPSNGPGRSVSANFILSELEVDAVQAIEIGDDFDDNVKDPGIWGADLSEGTAALSESGQRLDFTGMTAGDEDEAFAARPLVGNLLLLRDFFVQVDVTVPDVVPGPGLTAVLLGLVAANPNDLTDTFAIALTDDGNEGMGVLELLDVDDVTVRDGDLFAASTTATLGISWSVGEQLLRLFYDSDGPANGFSFLELGTGFNPLTGWGLATTDAVTMAVFGSMDGTVAVTPASGVFADNFVLVGGAFQPLTIEFLPTIRFPTELGSNYKIDASDSLAGPYVELGTVVGTGEVEAFVDTREVASKQFYRVRREIQIP